MRKRRGKAGRYPPICRTLPLSLLASHHSPLTTPLSASGPATQTADYALLNLPGFLRNPTATPPLSALKPAFLPLHSAPLTTTTVIDPDTLHSLKSHLRSRLTFVRSPTYSRLTNTALAAAVFVAVTSPSVAAFSLLSSHPPRRSLKEGNLPPAGLAYSAPCTHREYYFDCSS